MSERHAEYKEAFNAAVRLARLLGREVGISKSPKGYYRTDGFTVHDLPKPENRFGFELRCQVVRPDEPLMG